MLRTNLPHAHLVFRKCVDAVACLDDVERPQLARIVAQRKGLSEMVKHPMTLWTLVSADATWDVWFFGRSEGAIFARGEAASIHASIEGLRMTHEHAELEKLLQIARRRQYLLHPELDDLVHITPLMGDRATTAP